MFAPDSNIIYAGVNDLALDLFEGQYPLKNGISYNSYIIDNGSGHVAVMDSVDNHFAEEWLRNIETALGGKTPEFLIVQHAEPDHSGAVADFIRSYPDTKIVATTTALSILRNLTDCDLTDRSIAVTDNATLQLGGQTLRFFTAPGVHWPDVMMTYYEAEHVLFSADAFGTFATPTSDMPWDSEARRYYCNIVGKFGANVQRIIAKLAPLSISTIAPLHGPILTENLGHYLGLYQKWSTYTPESDGVLVAYASVYGGTAHAAALLADELRANGAEEVVTVDLCRTHISEALSLAFKYKRIALCTVTYDADIFPAMHHFIHHMGIKNLQNRTFALVENGSWAPVAARKMRDMLSHLKNASIVEPVLTIRTKFHQQTDTEPLRQLAQALLNS